MNFEYLIEIKQPLVNNEFQLTIVDDIKGSTSITYVTEWTADRIEMYHDAITFLNSLMKSAEELKERILSDIKETVDEMGQER